MECPACKKQTEEMTAADITVDVCKEGCGGLWFDRFEFRKVDEQHESAGESLIDIQIDGSPKVDHSERRKCPRCDDMIMMRHFFSVKKEVEVDECAQCGGIWLDYGELGRIRGQFESQDDRKKAAEAYFQDIFGVELQKMQAENDDKREKAKKIASIFRFICPSNYLSGKQSWGAF